MLLQPWLFLLVEMHNEFIYCRSKRRSNRAGTAGEPPKFDLAWSENSPRENDQREGLGAQNIFMRRFLKWWVRVHAESKAN